MKYLDRLLQQWRARMVARHIPAGARVLDIGCADGRLFELLGGRISYGVGIDSELQTPVTTSKYVLLPGEFPKDLPPAERRPYSVITALAVLEHIPPAASAEFARCCADYLEPNGLVILTVPSPAVDRILSALLAVRLIDGMSLEQHHGFEVSDAVPLFESVGLKLVRHSSFQLGLNNLFVFSKSGKYAA